jgi:hypothetical protein
MKRLFFIGVLLPIMALSQNKTVVSTNRVFPKADKIMEFEKALANHAQKYHTGTWKWRVFTIESGPDAGGYHIVEGPTTWDEVDKRGDLGAEHMNDWMKSVMPLVTDKAKNGYSVYREDLSTIGVTDYTDKIVINHVFPKPGQMAAVEETIKQVKKVWEASNQTIAVYEASASGEPQMAIVTRYKQGLKERERDFRKPMKERFEAVHGAGSFEKYLAGIASQTDHSWSEMLYYSAKLSSK